MTAHDGGITTKRLVKDTCVGKKKVAILPHLIANTVDDLARGRAESVKPMETIGEPSLIKPGKARGLVTKTKEKISRYEELTPEQQEIRKLHKGVGSRMRR